MWARGYITPAVLGVPNTQRTEKMRNGYLTAAVSGSLVVAKCLHNPNLLRGPKIGDQFTTRPKCGQRGYISRAVSGVPNAQCGEEIRNGHLTLPS